MSTYLVHDFQVLLFLRSRASFQGLKQLVRVYAAHEISPTIGKGMGFRQDHKHWLADVEPTDHQKAKTSHPGGLVVSHGEKHG
ncbi:MAG: hypothetical protein ACYCZ4_04900 [Sulfuricella sp.]|nr:hypothetical protein [Gammaproteobacteria bacterium]